MNTESNIRVLKDFLETIYKAFKVAPIKEHIDTQAVARAAQKGASDLAAQR